MMKIALSMKVLYKEPTSSIESLAYKFRSPALPSATCLAQSTFSVLTLLGLTYSCIAQVVDSYAGQRSYP